LRVLILSSDPLSEKMGGIGLRYRRLIEHFSSQVEVWAWAPESVEGLPETVVHWNGKSLTGVDAVIAPPMCFLAFPVLLASDTFLIADMIDPLTLENAFLYPKDELRLRAYSNLLLLALWRADHFVVAHRRQRDLWTGMLLGTRRMDSGTLARDSATDDVFTEFPTPGPDAPCHPHDSPGETVLWWGGLWDWLDPLTLLEAFTTLGPNGPRKLTFIGLRHPSGNVPVSREAREIEKRVRKSPPAGKTIEVVDWIPYEERAKPLEEACVGVSLHRNTIEGEFAYRTRLLDLFWAGVPVIASQGEYLGDLAARSGAALTVPPGSVPAVREAIMTLWSSRETARRMSAAGHRFAESLSWAERAPAFGDRVRGAASKGPILGRAQSKTLYRKYREVRSEFRRIGSFSHRLKTAIRREGFWGLFRRT
jgi:glycosyltransferase involved in cell wall biosynthesis